MDDAEIVPDTNLAEVRRIIDSGVNVVVELWAPWCHPCELMKTVLEKIASSDNYRNFAFVRLNADEYPSSYEEFGARALPALIGFHKGSACGKLIGFHREESTVKFLESFTGCTGNRNQK